MYTAFPGVPSLLTALMSVSYRLSMEVFLPVRRFFSSAPSRAFTSSSCSPSQDWRVVSSRQLASTFRGPVRLLSFSSSLLTFRYHPGTQCPSPRSVDNSGKCSDLLFVLPLIHAVGSLSNISKHSSLLTFCVILDPASSQTLPQQPFIIRYHPAILSHLKFVPAYSEPKPPQPAVFPLCQVPRSLLLPQASVLASNRTPQRSNLSLVKFRFIH